MLLTFNDFLKQKTVRERVDMGKLGSHYLGRAHADARQVGRVQVKPAVEAPAAVLEALKNVDWRDIRFMNCLDHLPTVLKEIEAGTYEPDDEQFSPGDSDVNNGYYAILPKDLRELIRDAARGENVELDDYWMGANSNNRGVYIELENDGSHRSHMPIGISEQLRGLGLGAKLYRAFLHHHGFLSSSSSATPEAKRTWASMVKNKLSPSGAPGWGHVMSLAINNHVLAIDPKMAREEARVAEVVKSFLEHTGDTRARPGAADVDPVLHALLKRAAPGLAGYFEPARMDINQAHASANARRFQDIKDMPYDHQYPRLLDELIADDPAWKVGDYVYFKSDLHYADYRVIKAYRVVGRNEEGYYLLVMPHEVDEYLRTGVLPENSSAEVDPNETGLFLRAKHAPHGEPPAGPLPARANERVDTAKLPNHYLGARADDMARDRHVAALDAEGRADSPRGHQPSLPKQQQALMDAFEGLGWREIRFIGQHEPREARAKMLREGHAAHLDDDDDDDFVRNFGAGGDYDEKVADKMAIRAKTEFYYVVLPLKLRRMLAAFYETSGADFGLWTGVDDSIASIHMTLDLPSHRAHFPVGLPALLLGLGLGTKLYRAFLRKAVHLTSNLGATPAAQRAWVSMVRNKTENGQPTREHVMSIAHGFSVLAIDPSANSEEIADAVGHFMHEFEPSDMRKGAVDVDPVLAAHLREHDPATYSRFQRKGVVESYETFLAERVDYDKLAGTYLGAEHAVMQTHKAAAAVAAAAATRPAFSVEPTEQSFAKAALFEALRGVLWDTIRFQHEPQPDGEEFYYIVLPENARDAMARFYQAVGSHFFGKWALVGSTPRNAGVHFDVDVDLDINSDGSGLNRSHFPNKGIDTRIRGLGLGPKLYRALLRATGYLTSDAQAEPEAVRSWVSMTRNKVKEDGSFHDDHVCSVVVGDAVLAIDPYVLEDGAKLDVAKRFIDHWAGKATPDQRNYDMDPMLRALFDAKAPEYLLRFDPALKAENDRKRTARRAEVLAAGGD